MPIKNFPEEGELVICIVKKILHNSIFASLTEYGEKEGLIHISEIAPGRIRNIRDYVKEGKQIVCKVLKTDEAKGHIDLSLRRVTTNLMLKKLSEFKQEQKAEKIIEITAKKLNLDVRKTLDSVKEVILKNYDLINDCFKEIVITDKPILASLGIDKKISSELTKIVKEKIRPPEVQINQKIDVNCPLPNGIEVIKNSFKKTMDFAKSKNYEIKIGYLGAPHYNLLIKDADYKTAEKKINEITEFLMKDVKKSGGESLLLKK